MADEEPAQTEPEAAPEREDEHPALPVDRTEPVDELEETTVDSLWLPL